MDTVTPISICPHLAGSADECYVWFTGHATECHWVCPTCVASYPALPAGMLQATDVLIEYCRNEASWSWEGIVGKPEVKQRASSLGFTHQDYSLPSSGAGRWVDIQPDSDTDDQWFLLSADGDLAVTNFRRGEFKILFRLRELGFDVDDETGLCVSSLHDYGAIYQTSNRHACVFTLETGVITARIDRGEYHPENSSFPIAFFQASGRTLLVAATNWNRLDIIDPSTGTVLTNREPPSYKRDEPRQLHYLDYFHAQVVISPDGRWIVDNGWVWHPWGYVRSWNICDWLEQNPWESEDGPSTRTLAGRAYYWDGALCWVDDSTVAIWGFGRDDEWLIPAVCLFDVRNGCETRWFPGPECRRPRAWPPKKLAPSLFFDRYLFSVHDEQGTSVWDVSTGERLLEDSSFAPICYHARSMEFLSLRPGGVRLSRLTTVAPAPDTI